MLDQSIQCVLYYVQAGGVKDFIYVFKVLYICCVYYHLILVFLVFGMQNELLIVLVMQYVFFRWNLELK